LKSFVCNLQRIACCAACWPGFAATGRIECLLLPHAGVRDVCVQSLTSAGPFDATCGQGPHGLSIRLELRGVHAAGAATAAATATAAAAAAAYG
jgi:hypothetical protein